MKNRRKTMYKIYVVINKKKIFKKKTRSFTNMQGFLESLRRRGFFCEVEYPKGGAK